MSPQPAPDFLTASHAFYRTLSLSLCLLDAYLRTKVADEQSKASRPREGKQPPLDTDAAETARGPQADPRTIRCEDAGDPAACENFGAFIAPHAAIAGSSESFTAANIERKR